MNPRSLVSSGSPNRWLRRLATALAAVSAWEGHAAAQGPALRMVSPWDQQVVEVGLPSASARIQPASYGQPIPAAEGGAIPAPTVNEGLVEGAPVVASAGDEGGPWHPVSTCPPSWYGSAAFAYFNNNASESVTRSQSFALDDYDFEEGFKVTIGRMFDCTEGWEATYVGPFRWVTGASFNSFGGNLQSTWILIDPAAGGLLPAEVSAFNNSTYHALRHQSELHSFEIGSKTWGWDVFTFTSGIRYLKYDEEFLFLGINQQNQAGAFLTETQNDLIGGQLGVEFRYHFLPNWSVASKYKGGLFANLTDTQTQLTNNGALILNNGEEDVDWAAMAEISGYLSHHFGQRATAFVGFDLWYVYNLALASEQTDNVLVRDSGRRVVTEGDIWLNGLTAGVEVAW